VGAGNEASGIYRVSVSAQRVLAPALSDWPENLRLTAQSQSMGIGSVRCVDLFFYPALELLHDAVRSHANRFTHMRHCLPGLSPRTLRAFAQNFLDSGRVGSQFFSLGAGRSEVIFDLRQQQFLRVAVPDTTGPVACRQLRFLVLRGEEAKEPIDVAR